ncbi:MAG: hypothetical protein HONBIEJF_02331 [Fimbriimonadaceae bacterium]|nr:hypothetical protein [Fimbriimonadaceae bacterium]
MVIAFALTVLGCWQVSEVPKLPDAKMIRMGRSKWFDYYTSRAGSSTMAMCDAESFYGEAVRRTNDKTLARHPTKMRRFVGSTRTLLTNYRNSLIELGSIFSGGGTMWNPVYAGTMADVEEVVAKILDPKAKAMTKRDAPTVVKALAAWRPKLEHNREDVDHSREMTGGYDRGLKCLAIADTNLAAISEVTKNQSKRVAELVFEFCHEQTKLPNVAVGD